MNQPLNLAPAATDHPLEALPETALNPRTLRQRLREAADYDSWAEAAKALDRLSGREVWKKRDISALYDYRTLRDRVDHLRAVRAANDHHGLVFAIEEGVHGNLGGMGKPMLYNKARFGTKQLIRDYVDSVSDALRHIETLSESEMPLAAKLDLFRRASHCYGRSALMFSAGGTLMYFHFGVAKALLEQGILPRVLSGSSSALATPK